MFFVPQCIQLPVAYRKYKPKNGFLIFFSSRRISCYLRPLLFAKAYFGPWIKIPFFLVVYANFKMKTVTLHPLSYKFAFGDRGKSLNNVCLQTFQTQAISLVYYTSGV